MGTPAAGVVVDETLVRRLLEAQHPDLAALPVRHFGSGWDNVMFRLGEELLVRLPRRELAAPLAETEHAWLPVLAPRLPLATPVPVRVGKPGAGYPWAWSVVPWVPGATVDTVGLGPGQAARWADFLLALHQPAPGDAPINPVRGVPLEQRRAVTEERLQALVPESVVEPAHRRLWRDALAARPSTERRWLHGDLHPHNVLGTEGRITAVIDWGDLAGGDVATDLASVWLLFDDPAARRKALERYAPDADLLARARGWALAIGAFAAGLEPTSPYRALGRAVLRRLKDGHG
jgi:aminoglycoside phosphotransferase (APT) family kinase protein